MGAKVSNDLLADQNILGGYLDEVVTKEIAFMIVDLMIGGPGYPSASLIGGPATIKVSRAGGNAVALADIDGMWAGLYGLCKAGAVWMCNDDTFSQIETLAVTEAWLRQFTFRRWRLVIRIHI